MTQKEQRTRDQQLKQIQDGMFLHLKQLSKRELIRTVMGQVNMILELRNQNNQLQAELNSKPQAESTTQPELQKDPG